MIVANVPKKMRYKLFPQAFATATKLDNLIMITVDGKTKTRYEYWCGKIPAFVKNLRTRREAGTVKIKLKKNHLKLMTMPLLYVRGIPRQLS